MGDPPEALRLFDLPGPAAVPERGDKNPSRDETAEPSRHETRSHPSQTEMADQHAEPLRLVAEAARMERTARARLVEAIAAARAAGHSWRELGTASGVPHQSLHRRFRP